MPLPPDLFQAESPWGRSCFTFFFNHVIWPQIYKRLGNSSNLTSFGFGEALVKAEDDLVYKVLDVSGLWTPDKHHPVVREAF